MTLAAVLEIDENSIDESRYEAALQIAEDVWCADGCPTGRELIPTLERILGTCQRRRAEYPKILLRRKKELERGDWTPVAESRRESRSSSPSSYSPPPSPRSQDGPASWKQSLEEMAAALRKQLGHLDRPEDEEQRRNLTRQVQQIEQELERVAKKAVVAFAGTRRLP